MKRLCSISIGCALLALAAGSARAAVQKTEIIAAVQAAFDTWSKATCTNLKFEYKGELDSFVTEKQGAILVYFGYDSLTWTSQAPVVAGAYVQNTDTSSIVRAVIGFDAHDWVWGFGKAKYTFDIQTAVTEMLPVALGFYVGADPVGHDLWLYQDHVATTLTPLQEQGAQFVYPGAGCTKPAQPPICGGPQKADAGVPADAAGKDKGLSGDKGSSPDAPPAMHLCVVHSNPSDLTKGAFYHWADSPIPWYIYLNATYGNVPGGLHAPDGGVRTKDLGISPAAGDGGGGSKGCCRVSHAENGASGGLLILSLLAALLLIAHRRRP